MSINQPSPSKSPQPQTLFQTLIQKLHSSLSPSQTPLTEGKLNLYNRILFSRFNLFQYNESQIVNTLFDKAEKIHSSASKASIEQIERLQTLYTRISKKKIPTK